MKKNVASQSIGVQMITAADGTAFTGTVTVLVTIDNGTQSASGGTAPVHEGNGYHSYTPTQAETNGDHIAFTFTGTGAIPATVQVFTGFPQTVDNATNISAILTDTAEIGVAGAGLTDLGGMSTTMKAQVNTEADTALTDYDPPTNAEMEARTLVAASYFDPAADTVATVTTVTSGATAAELAKVPKSDSTVTWNATALASINAECDTAITDASLATAAALTTAQNDLDIITGATGVNLLTATQASIDAIEADTNSLNDTKIPNTLNITASGNIGIDWANVENPTTVLDLSATNIQLCDTVTTNTDMRGTDSALLAASINLTGGAVDTVTTVTNQVTADTTAIAGITAAATNLSKSAIGIEPGAAITGTLSTTQMTTDLTEVTDDHYNGRIIVWTSGVLKNQATDITDYTGASKLLTYTATTEAPANTDTFVII